MSERSLLLFEKSPKRKAAVVGGLALAIALTGCGGPKDPILIGDGRPDCADNQLALPQIKLPASQRQKAEDRLLVAERRLCATVAEVGPRVLGLYQHRGNYEDAYGFSTDATGKGASRYDVEITQTIKATGDKVHFTVNTSEVNGDDKKLSINYPKEVKVESGFSDASISLESGRWSISSNRAGLHDDKWPKTVSDFGLIANMEEVKAFEDNTKAIQAAIFDVAGPITK